MKIKHFITRIIHSVRSSDSYIPIASEKMSKAWLNFLLIICLVGLISGIVQGVLTHGQLQDVITITKSNTFPDFLFSNGEFTIDRDQPIIYTYQKYYTIIIDPTNTKNINDLAGYDAGYLLQPTSLYISTIGNSPIRYDLSLIKDFHFNKDALIGYLEFIAPILIPLVVLMSIIYILVATLFKSLFLYILGIMLRSMNQISTLTNSGLYKMVLYAIPLGIILTETVALILMVTPIIHLNPWIASVLPFLTFYLPSSFLLSKGLKTYLDTKTPPSTPQ